MQRRQFLTATAASATLAATAKAAILDPGLNDATLSRSRLQSWIGREFRIAPHGRLRGFNATLASVKDGPSHPGLQQFSAVWRGTGRLPSGLCSLVLKDGERFALHLEEVDSDGTHQLRRATFSLLESRHV